jgi:hypothetical protein
VHWGRWRNSDCGKGAVGTFRNWLLEISEKWLCDFMLSDGWSFVFWVLVMGVKVEQLTPHREQ